MSVPVPIPVLRGVTREMFESEIRPAARPVVLAGLVADWPLVRAACQSAGALADGIKALDGGRVPQILEAPPASGGRLFYRDDLEGFNFTRRPLAIGDLLDRLLRLSDEADAPAVYLESLPTAAYLPTFARSHVMPLLDAHVEPRIWMGNAVKVNTHFDLVYNLACVVGGRRRFTLFPPGQVRNLYLAPLDFTPSGAPVSLAQLTQADHARFPRLAAALREAQHAELGPGDALYIPYGWWHHVESLTPFNVLVNYWWNDAPDHGTPHGALLHSLLAIRDLPADQRAVWASLFEELVFTDPETALAHLPPAKRGMLGPPSAERSRGIRERLARELNARLSPESPNDPEPHAA
jgi:Cupin-like domain